MKRGHLCALLHRHPTIGREGMMTHLAHGTFLTHQTTQLIFLFFFIWKVKVEWCAMLALLLHAQYDIVNKCDNNRLTFTTRQTKLDQIENT